MSWHRPALDKILDWTCGGVDFTLDGNGGPQCATYISTQRKILETATVGLLALSCVCWGMVQIRRRKSLVVSHIVPCPEPCWKKVLLALMCLTFGMELGFKFSSKTMVFALNPCHVVTVLQIYLLLTPPSKLTVFLFRCQVYCLNGPIVAIFFPVLNTRMYPFETEVYFIQHGLMLIIPYHLMKIAGVYTIEEVHDYSWGIMTLGIHLLYNFLFLQGLGLLTFVNLNNILCPAVSDPFSGQNYRIWACCHQSLLVLLSGKTYGYVAQKCLQRHHPEPTRVPSKTPSLTNCDECASSGSYSQRVCSYCKNLIHTATANGKSEGHED